MLLRPPVLAQLKWGERDPESTSVRTYKTVDLHYVYRGEEKGLSHAYGPDNQVRYLNKYQRTFHRVKVKDSIIYDAFGDPLTTEETRSNGTKIVAIYVMDPAGNIYISTQDEYGSFHHSSLSAGMAVAAAGQIEVRDGKVIRINRASGHYKPPEWAFDQIIQRLKDGGVDFKAVELGGAKEFPSGTAWR